MIYESEITTTGSKLYFYGRSLLFTVYELIRRSANSTIHFIPQVSGTVVLNFYAYELHITQIV